VHVHVGRFVFFNFFKGVSNEAGINVIDSQRSGLGKVAPCQRIVFRGEDWIAALKTVEECGQRDADKEIYCHAPAAFRFGDVPKVFSGVGGLEVVDDPFQVFAACGDSVELGARLERKDLPAVATGGAALSKYKLPDGRDFERSATLGAIYLGEEISWF